MLLRVLRQVNPYILLQLNGQPAIDDKRVAGDERSLARAQEDNRIGDVDGRAGSSQWVLLLKKRSPSGWSSQRAPLRSVTMWPGQIALTRTPDGPYSAASWRVRPITAGLTASYTLQPGATSNPCTEEMLTIAPPPAATRCGTAYLAARNIDFKPTSNARSHVSSVVEIASPRPPPE